MPTDWRPFDFQMGDVTNSGWVIVAFTPSSILAFIFLKWRGVITGLGGPFQFSFDEDGTVRFPSSNRAFPKLSQSNTDIIRLFNFQF